MRLGGLFVGADRQQDCRIQELAFAARDAEALGAAFEDENHRSGTAGHITVLTGVRATAERVRGALGELAREARELELVAILFSCHGTSDGRLLFCDADQDADPDDRASSVGLDEIVSALAEVRAPMLVIAFDSCFSGLATSGAAELTRSMEALAQGNRAVVWAAGSAERAWESARHRHGYLTHGLLEAMYGKQARTADGRLGIGAWLARAVEIAAEEARRDRRAQTPGLLMHMSADASVPAFVPGARRAAMLEELSIFAVAPDLAGLERYGFDAASILAVRRRIRGGALNDLQQLAIAAGALAGRNVVVAAPTSAGKSLVGELCALRAAQRRRKTAVLVPMRALAAEKWEDHRRFYAATGARGARAYGGVQDDDHLIARGHFDVAFFTYEKFASLAFTRPELCDALGLVVVDEAHMIGDPERGRVVELILTRLRMKRATQIVVLSAALGDLSGLHTWLDATLVREERRPVPLVQGVVGPSGVYRHLDAETGEVRERRILPSAVETGDASRFDHDEEVRGRVALALATELVREGERLIVFRAHREGARWLATNLALGAELPACSGALDAHDATDASDPSRASRELEACLKGGTAFHISDLERREREAIEAAFREGHLRALTATAGLAMGINTPATSVIVADHERFDGRERRPIGVGDYQNMAGRAGRWIDGVERGTSYLVAETDGLAAELFETYVRGTPDALESRLASFAPEDLALALLMLAGEATPRRLVEIAGETFEGFRSKRRGAAFRARKARDLAAALARLEQAGFVTRAPGAEGGAVAATALGRVCGRGNLSFASAERVLASAARLREAGEPLDALALLALVQLTDELDDVYTPAGKDEAAPWLEGVPHALGGRTRLAAEMDVACGAYFLRRTRAYKRLVAVRRWLAGEPIEKIEGVFSHFQRRTDQPVAGAIRQAAERTADLLLPVGRLLSLAHPDQAEALAAHVAALRPRLEHGVGREVTELLRMRVPIQRAQALRLVALGIASPRGLRDALAQGDARLAGVFSERAREELSAALSSGRSRPADAAAAERATREFWDQLAMDDAI
jgi:replicative superfamily II helicase